jgi:putative heme-binding domain-containing protein
VALKRSSDPRVGQLLLAGWSTYAPALRDEALNVLLSRKEWTRALLNAMERSDIPPGELGNTQQQRLLSHSDNAIQKQAARLFATARSNRQQLLLEYQQVDSLSGVAARGEPLFKANCATCHRFKGEGQNVGPELDAAAQKPVEALLAAILDPNQAVEWRYVNFQAVTKSGQEISGIIAAETPTSITLRTASGQEETLLRADLEKFESTKLSLMPEGFEQGIKPQDMADLIAYLRSR